MSFPSNEKSAQVCGCDPGCGEAGYLCERHRSTPEPTTPSDKGPGLYYSDETREAIRQALDAPNAFLKYFKSKKTFPNDATARKQHPVASGVLDYFPDAIAAVAHVSWVGNEQHNPGQPLHWDRSKSTDEADALMRHFLERGTLDSDGTRHSAKVAWRALAALQKEIEAERAAD